MDYFLTNKPITEVYFWGTLPASRDFSLLHNLQTGSASQPIRNRQTNNRKVFLGNITSVKGFFSYS
jgi:hypothetical protein